MIEPPCAPPCPALPRAFFPSSILAAPAVEPSAALQLPAPPRGFSWRECWRKIWDKKAKLAMGQAQRERGAGGFAGRILEHIAAGDRRQQFLVRRRRAP